MAARSWSTGVLLRGITSGTRLPRAGRSSQAKAALGAVRRPRRTGDLAARTYPGAGDDHPIWMISALCASA